MRCLGLASLVLGAVCLGAAAQAQPTQVGPDQLVRTYLAPKTQFCPTNCYSCVSRQ
jgi:hypothetical protein